MFRWFLLCAVLMFGSVSAGMCAKQPTSLPVPANLRHAQGFVLLVDGEEGGSDPYLILGTPRSFSELREDFTARLQAAGWEVIVPVRKEAESTRLTMKQKDSCLSYDHLTPSNPFIEPLMADAKRNRTDFATVASGYRTVLRVQLFSCPM